MRAAVFDPYVVVLGACVVFSGDADGLTVIVPDFKPSFIDLAVDEVGLQGSTQVPWVEGVHVELRV